MKHLVIIFLLVSSSISFGSDLLDILSDNSGGDKLKILQKGNNTSLRHLVRGATPEANIFFSFLEAGKNRKALFQWESAFKRTSFSRSTNGKALRAYLDYVNGLKVKGVEGLMSSGKPKSIDKTLWNLWAGQLDLEKEVWSYIDVRWDSAWQGFLPLQAEISLRSRAGGDQSLKELNGLLKKTADGSKEQGVVLWQYVIGLIEKGDDFEAAKFIKYFLGIKQDTIGKDLLNISVARILYQNGHLGPSGDYYEKVNKRSSYWFLSQEELGWSYLRRGEPQNALGITKGLMHKSFNGVVGAETYYLRALSLLKICDYTEVLSLLTDFRDRFRPRVLALTELQKNPNTKSIQRLFDVIGADKPKFKKIGSFYKELPLAAFNDQSLRFRVRRARALKKESELAERLFVLSLGEASSSVGFQGQFEEIKNSMIQRQKLAEGNSLGRIRDLAKDDLADIERILRKMQIIEAELVQQLALSDRVAKQTDRDVKKLIGRSSKDKHSLKFPFDGEVWFDELTNYKVDVAGGCKAKAI